MFIAKCAKETGISSSVINHNAVWACATDLVGTGRVAENAVDPVASKWHERSSGYVPQTGDIIVYDWVSDGLCTKKPTSNYGDMWALCATFKMAGFTQLRAIAAGKSQPAI